FTTSASCAAPPPCSTLFPYTTLFRSHLRAEARNLACLPLGEKDVHQRPALWAVAALDEIPAFARERRLFRQRAGGVRARTRVFRSEEHTSELQSRGHLVCRLLLGKKT